ncbi:MAG TPA: hypothetical protein VMW04_02220 [Patescibacteria group bacterium]|nr:hypothetical protein [Patescibacteria group bacterium]
MASEVTPVKNDEVEPVIELVIRPPTADEEYDRVASYLRKLPWYNENGYKLPLPTHPAFQQLAQPGADLAVLDLEETRRLFAQEVYDPTAYEARLRAVEADRFVIEEAYLRFRELNKRWGVKVFPRYEITLTQFGAGGSYDSEKGRVIILTSSRHSPKRIAIHEGVHIGIEDGIVQKYGLSHWEKERTVDKICSIRFGDLLPNYDFQARGDIRIDPYVTSETIRQLPQAMERYVKDFPRTQ